VDILGICAILRDILGKCAIQRGISWANVQYKEGYLGQMCNTKRDIWGKCAIIHVATLLLKKEDVVRLVDIYNMVGGGPCG
jgi:hypothetical protein